jgi:hypothetical protein
MNRKLHNSLMALSTTGLLLVVGLMAATPSAVPAGAETGSEISLTDIDADVQNPKARAAAAIDARAKAFEEELRNAGDAEQAIAATAAFVAEAALTAALAELKAEEPAAEAEPAAREASRKRRSSRSALALPYFSFARGLRGGNGD